MQTLIVCGTPWCDISTIQQTLEAAGMAAPKPASAGSVPDIALWYDRLFPGQVKPGAARMGKSWELAAGEIFLANWDQPVWGWGDTRNTWLLDFWRDFDAGIHFVLVYTPPHTALAAALADVSVEPFDPSTVLDQWCAYQSEMLRFFHRNRARCSYIDGNQAVAAPEDMLQRINARLGCTLAAVPPLRRATVPSALEMWLAQQALNEHPAAQALQQELLSTVPGCDNLPVEATQNMAAVLAELRVLYRDRAANADAIKQSREELAAAADQSLQQCALLQEEAAQLQEALLEQRHEKDMLLVQLHEVQEDFETTLISLQTLQQRETAQSEGQQPEPTADGQVTQGHSQALREQLEEAQAALQRCAAELAEAKQAQRANTSRWERLLALDPEYCEWDAISSIGSTAEPRWQILGLAISEQPVPVMDIGLECNEGRCSLIVHPPAGSDSVPLYRWPRLGNAPADAPLTALHLHPGEPWSTLDRALLRQLAPRDIRLLQAACRALSQSIGPGQSGREQTVAQLNALLDQFKRLPPAFRYDTVRLKRERVVPGYEQLWFSLGEANYGDRHWPEFEFCLGAAMVGHGFSSLPRLEFPRVQNGPQQLTNWFEESADEDGPKFELRYDIARNAVDVQNWAALNSDDQLQTLSLLGHLPGMMHALQHSGVHLSRPWADWVQLVLGMQKTMYVLGLPAHTFETI